MSQPNLPASANPAVLRPLLHFTPPAGWMNDPNGLVFYEGEYHLFYQHFPHATHWSTMHWGHAVSRDLVEWTHLPIGIYPDQIGPIYSGSAVVDRDNSSGLVPGGGLVAIFSYENQSQGIASSSDRGRTWTMYPGNPVIPSPHADFRDPKVFWHAPSEHWVMVIAAHDRIRFYTSPNLKDWTATGEFGQGQGSHSGVWECPDLFALTANGETHWVLLVSVNGGAVAGGSGTQYFVGRFDGQQFTTGQSETLWLDYGPDNYAGVTWNDVPDGRRLLIGWLNNWEYGRKIPASTWRGTMTLPRELALLDVPGVGPRLVQMPLGELAARRGEARTRSNDPLTGETDLLADLRASVFELIADIELGSAAEVGLRVRVGDDEWTSIVVNAVEQTLSVDRSVSGVTDFHPAFPAHHPAPLPVEDGRVRLHVVVDHSSVEVFANDGGVAISSQIFPDKGSDRLALYTNGGTALLRRLEFYPLR